MKKINVLLLSLLMFGAAMAQDMADRYHSISEIDINEQFVDINKNPIDGSKAVWDVMWTFTGNRSGQPGIETDGMHFYCPAWKTDTITRFDMNGENATDFTISGVEKIRDLAYDGTYFYGAAADLNLKVMDLANETLIATINPVCSGITGIRHIAYDPALDGGNGGLWIGNWNELGAIDMDGNELIPNVAGNSNTYGSAYDDSNLSNPVLWLFQQKGDEKVTFQQFDINALTYTDVSHEATDIPGYEPGAASSAGGACIWDDPVLGVKLLIGNIQQGPNLIFAYSISDINSEPVFADNFDSYNTDEMLACQNPDVWTTWSGSPCGDDDAFISDNYAYSGTNSVSIAPDDDIVLDLPEYLSSGRYSVETMIYVPSGGNAYYNILTSFQEPQEWAFEVYFREGGDGDISAGLDAAATFNYEFDTWMESKVIVDLDGDWAEYYLDDTLIYAWQWTLGASGGGCALQLGALDFYGQANSDYYFDNITIYHEDALPTPSSLTADVIDTDVGLNWTAAGPSANNFLGYNVYRDEEIIATEISDITYSDNNLPPGIYVYDVKAIFDEGISDGAGPVEAIVEGGVDRDLVIIEVATGTWCTYCPGAAMGVDDLHAEGLSVGVIEYHGSDAYETVETDLRLDFYENALYPTTNFDGGNTIEGGNSTESLYPYFLPIYEERIAKPSLFEIEAEYINTGGENYQVSVNAEMIEAYTWLNNEIVLQVVLTESHIEENWQNQSELNFVCRDMIPNQNGTILDFEGNTTQSVELDFVIPSSYDMSNIELLAFIQDNNTREILQGTMSAFITGIENVTDHVQIDVYPNPATDQVNISASMDILSMTVYNNVGQVVFVKNIDNSSYLLNTNNYKSGLYVIQLETEDGMITKRVVIE